MRSWVVKRGQRGSDAELGAKAYDALDSANACEAHSSLGLVHADEFLDGAGAEDGAGRERVDFDELQQGEFVLQKLESGFANEARPRDGERTSVGSAVSHSRSSQVSNAQLARLDLKLILR